MAKDKYENLSEAEITALESRRLEKQVKRRSEIKSFLVLLLIFLAIGGGTWYWYTHIYDSDRNKKNEESTKIEYEIVKIDATKEQKFIKIGNYIALVNNSDNLEKIYDNAGKEYDLSKSKIKINDDDFNESNLMIGFDHNLYAYQTEQGEYGSVITIYKFNNGSFEKEKELVGESVYYQKIIYQNGDEKLLIGFAGSDNKSDGETEDNTFYYYILGKELEKNKEFEFAGDESRISIEDPYYTRSDTYITTRNGGLVNYKTNEIVIEDYYDGLYSTYNNNYIACKDNKCGIIDIKQKPLTEMIYDFIDARNKDFYVVSKDGKIAIMDLNYKVISDYSINYNGGFNYKPCCGEEYELYEAFKQGTTYYINITPSAETQLAEKEAYQITKDGKVTSINFEDEIQVLEKTTSKETIYYNYNKETEKLTIYDNDKEKYTISNVQLEDQYLYIDLLDNNNLQIGYSKKKYYDYQTGKELDKAKEYILEDNELKITYDYDKSILTINDKEENKYNIDMITVNDIYKNENNYYIVSNKYLIFINNKGK